MENILSEQACTTCCQREIYSENFESYIKIKISKSDMRRIYKEKCYLCQEPDEFEEYGFLDNQNDFFILTRKAYLLTWKHAQSKMTAFKKQKRQKEIDTIMKTLSKSVVETNTNKSILMVEEKNNREMF